MVDHEQEWETWRDWLGREPKGLNIYAEIVEMLAFRQVWRGFVVVHNRAPEEARRTRLFSGGSTGTTPEAWARQSVARSIREPMSSPWGVSSNGSGDTPRF
jgi:hypothetical protein